MSGCVRFRLLFGSVTQSIPTPSLARQDVRSTNHTDQPEMLGTAEGEEQREHHDCTNMTETCSKCGSTKVETINVEMAFARAKAEPVYALAVNRICLDCGFAECFLPQESLAKLRALVQA